MRILGFPIRAKFPVPVACDTCRRWLTRFGIGFQLDREGDMNNNTQNELAAKRLSVRVRFTSRHVYTIHSCCDAGPELKGDGPGRVARGRPLSRFLRGTQRPVTQPRPRPPVACAHRQHFGGSGEDAALWPQPSGDRRLTAPRLSHAGAEIPLTAGSFEIPSNRAWRGSWHRSRKR